jgi:ATP-dependent Zn protease
MDQNAKPKWWRGGLLYILILLVILALAFSFLPMTKKASQVDLYTFIDQAKKGDIDTILQDGTTIIGLKDNEKKIQSSFIGSTKELTDMLQENGVVLGENGIKFNVQSGGFDWGGISVSFVPLILFGALLFFLFRSARKKT